MKLRILLSSVMLQYSQFKKENSYYYDEPDREKLQAARKMELEFVEDLCKNQTIQSIEFSTITFSNSEAHTLCISLLIMPYGESGTSYRQFLSRFINYFPRTCKKMKMPNITNGKKTGNFNIVCFSIFKNIFLNYCCMRTSHFAKP